MPLINPNNEDRAGWAKEAVNKFRKTTGSDAEDAVADLLCDLMHLCQQKEKLYGTFDRALSRATDYYGEEIEEEQDDDDGRTRIGNTPHEEDTDADRES